MDNLAPSEKKQGIVRELGIDSYNNQQGPSVQHREFCSMSSGSLEGRGVWGRMDTCICKAESLCYTPETITLLISYTPIQNRRFK